MQTVSVRGWVKSRPSETDRADSKIPDCKAACKRTAVGPTAWQLDRLQHAGSRSVQWCALNWNTLTGSQYWGQAGTNYRGQAVLNGGRGRGRLCYTCFCHYVSSEQTTSFTPSPRHSQPFRFCAKIFQPVPLFWWGVGGGVGGTPFFFHRGTNPLSVALMRVTWKEQRWSAGQFLWHRGRHCCRAPENDGYHVMSQRMKSLSWLYWRARRSASSVVHIVYCCGTAIWDNLWTAVKDNCRTLDWFLSNLVSYVTLRDRIRWL